MKHFVQGTSVYIRKKDPTSHKYKYIPSTNSRILSTRYSRTLKSEADSPAPRQLLATVSTFALPHYHQAAPTVSPCCPTSSSLPLTACTWGPNFTPAVRWSKALGLLLCSFGSARAEGDSGPPQLQPYSSSVRFG